jgi:DNA-binding IscR family transcriptional regulator
MEFHQLRYFVAVAEELSVSGAARRLHLSVSNLESILKPLKDHQIVTSRKGPGGGYEIRGDLALISMWDIAAIFETTLQDQGTEAEPLNAACFEWGLEQVIIETLSQFALSDFVVEQALQVPVETPVVNRFKFKPLAAPLVPKAPNSVFQLHMAV